MRTQTVAACISFAVLIGCAGNGEGLDENGRPIDEGGGGGGGGGELTPDFASIQANVLTPICTGCHSGAAAPLGLRLEEGASYALLVNAPSTEVPTLLRVAPGDPDSSYLIQKLEGTAAVGGRMPLGGSPLPAETIAVIRQWIAEGAAAPAAAGDSEPIEISAAWPLDGAVLKRAPAIVLAAHSEIDASLLEAGTLKLRRSGGDGDFTNGNEVELAASVELRSLTPTVFAVKTLPDDWTEDRYELRVSGGAPLALASLNAVPIDGDADGTAGGDFVLSFTVEEVQ
jgi:hypothetical protein